MAGPVEVAAKDTVCPHSPSALFVLIVPGHCTIGETTLAVTLTRPEVPMMEEVVVSVAVTV